MEGVCTPSITLQREWLNNVYLHVYVKFKVPSNSLASSVGSRNVNKIYLYILET